MESTATFQQLNSELSYMKHSQEVSKSDLQAVKILLGNFLGIVHVWTNSELSYRITYFDNGSQ